MLTILYNNYNIYLHRRNLGSFYSIGKVNFLFRDKITSEWYIHVPVYTYILYYTILYYIRIVSISVWLEGAIIRFFTSFPNLRLCTFTQYAYIDRIPCTLNIKDLFNFIYTMIKVVFFARARRAHGSILLAREIESCARSSPSRLTVFRKC